MGLYTVREIREIVREALVDAGDADEAKLFFNQIKMRSGVVDIHTNTDERHVIVREYKEVDR